MHGAEALPVLPFQVEQYKAAEHEASVAALQSEELACRLDGDLAATRQRLLALEGGVKVGRVDGGVLTWPPPGSACWHWRKA